MVAYAVLGLVVVGMGLGTLWLSAPVVTPTWPSLLLSVHLGLAALSSFLLCSIWSMDAGLPTTCLMLVAGLDVLLTEIPYDGFAVGWLRAIMTAFVQAIYTTYALSDPRRPGVDSLLFGQLFVQVGLLAIPPRPRDRYDIVSLAGRVVVALMILTWFIVPPYSLQEPSHCRLNCSFY